MSNSRHNSAIAFSRRCAATTNRTRCSRMSIVRQAILSEPPVLASLARECKGCLGTPCKGCHGTEQPIGCDGPTKKSGPLVGPGGGVQQGQLVISWLQRFR